MIGTFCHGLDVLYHHAKFGEERSTRAGCKCENMVFDFSVTLQYSFNHCCYSSILTQPQHR